jgi:hypothetical protein
VEPVSPDVTSLKKLADGTQDAAGELVSLIYQKLHWLVISPLRHGGGRAEFVQMHSMS